MAALHGSAYRGAGAAPIFVVRTGIAAGHGEMEMMTQTRSFFSRIAAAAGLRQRQPRRIAVENHRSPAPSDLERLGISVVAFGAINRN